MMSEIILLLKRTVFLPKGSPGICTVREIKADIRHCEVAAEGGRVFCSGEADLLIEYLSFAAGKQYPGFESYEQQLSGGSSMWQALLTIPFELVGNGDPPCPPAAELIVGELKWFMVSPHALEMEIALYLSWQGMASAAQEATSPQQAAGWRQVTLLDMENKDLHTDMCPTATIKTKEECLNMEHDDKIMRLGISDQGWQIATLEQEQCAQNPVEPEPAITEPGVCECTIPEPVVPEPAIQEAAMPEPALETAVIAEKTTEKIVLTTAEVEEIIAETTAAKDIVIKEAVAEESATVDIVIEKAATKETAKEATIESTIASTIAETVTEKVVIKEVVTEEVIIDEVVTEEAIIAENVAEEAVADVTITEEAVIGKATVVTESGSESLCETITETFTETIIEKVAAKTAGDATSAPLLCIQTVETPWQPPVGPQIVEEATLVAPPETEHLATRRRAAGLPQLQVRREQIRQTSYQVNFRMEDKQGQE